MPSHTNYRAIIRLSLNGENIPTAAIRNEITKTLDLAGLAKIEDKTGVYETKSANIIDIQKRLNEVLENLANISVDDDHASTLDHIWIYIDKV